MIKPLMHAADVWFQLRYTGCRERLGCCKDLRITESFSPELDPSKKKKKIRQDSRQLRVESSWHRRESLIEWNRIVRTRQGH